MGIEIKIDETDDFSGSGSYSLYFTPTESPDEPATVVVHSCHSGNSWPMSAHNGPWYGLGGRGLVAK